MAAVGRMRRRFSAISGFVVVCAVVACGPAWCEDLQGLKDQLTQQGLAPALIYDGDAFANAAGGTKRGGTYAGNLHLQLGLDGGRLVNAPGLTAFLHGLWIHGGQPSSFAGDAQGVSNLAAPAAARLYEAWLQYNFLGNRWSILAGRYDLNTEFYHLQSAGLFVNSSFGIGPEFAQSGVAGPSIFPDTSVGVRLAYQPVPGIVLRVAIMDGAPVDRPDGSVGIFKGGDGLLLVSEATFLTRPALGNPFPNMRFRIGRSANLPLYDGKIAVGAWHYTTTFSDLSAVDASGVPVRRNGSGGGYLLADRSLYQAPGDPKKRLAGFVQLGIGDARVDRFGWYIGSGLIAMGMLPGRPDDEVGIATAVARNGSHYIASQEQQGLPVAAAEIALELTYLAQVNQWLALQPDVQYVVHPGTNPMVRNATTFQLRFELAF
jgi:porin